MPFSLALDEVFCISSPPPLVIIRREGVREHSKHDLQQFQAGRDERNDRPGTDTIKVMLATSAIDLVRQPDCPQWGRGAAIYRGST